MSWFEKLHDTFIEGDRYKMLLEGLGNTLLITIGALLIGVLIGGAIAIAKYYAEGNPKLKVVNFICDLYTTVIRGIPVTVLLLIFFYIILVSAEGVTVAIIAFGINSGAYMAELVRSGINAVDRGQMEAARSLGMSKWQAMRTIILPQAIKNILPALCNEFITIIKETSLASTFFVGELMTVYLFVKGITFSPIPTLMIVGVIYFVLNFILSKALKIVERKLKAHA